MVFKKGQGNYPLSSGDLVEELPTGSILNDHEDVGFGVDELVVLDNMRVVELSEHLSKKDHNRKVLLFLASPSQAHPAA